MGFRDDGEAARERADALEQENRALRQQLERKESPGPAPRRNLLVLLGVLVLLVGGALIFFMRVPLIVLPVAVVMLTLLFMLVAMSRLVCIAQPNELLIVSGRQQRLSDGSIVGYRVVRNRVVRMPFIERVDRLSLEIIPIEVELGGVCTEGGERVTLQAAATVKISSVEPDLHAAVERFLGSSREQIAHVAREALGGTVRAAAGSASVEELQRGAERLVGPAEDVLRDLGLKLDTLHLRRVQLD